MMIIRIFTLLTILVLQLSCSAQLNEIEDKAMENPEVAIKSNYLALGDSYTIGQSVPESDRFPVLLVNALNQLEGNYDPPRIIARTGWTTDELDAAIAAENVSDTFDLVTLLIGVNNQFRGRDVEEFRVQFADLLEQALAFAANKKENVIVVSIPDWGVSPFAEGRNREKISQEIDLFNSVKLEECNKKEVKFVDITPISRQALNQSIYFASDGLHFSGAMHQLWVDEIIKTCFN